LLEVLAAEAPNEKPAPPLLEAVAGVVAPNAVVVVLAVAAPVLLLVSGLGVADAGAPKLLFPPNENADAAGAAAETLAEPEPAPKEKADEAGAAVAEPEAVALELEDVVPPNAKLEPEDAPKAGAEEVEAAPADEDVEEPNEKAAPPVLKPDVVDDIDAPVPTERPAPAVAAAAPSAAPSGLGALEPKENADEDAAPEEPASGVLPKLNADEMGALPPVGADEPKANPVDPKLDVAGAVADAAAGRAADTAAGAASGALPSDASSASSSLLPVDSNPTSTFLSGHWKPPVTQPFLAASAAFFEALGSIFN